MKKILSLLTASILTLCLAAPTLGAKSTGTVVLNTPDPVYGQVINFTTVANVANYTWIECYQDGQFVLWGGGLVHAAGETYSTNVGLSSGAYTGGPAECVAQIKKVTAHHIYRVIEEIEFHVNAN